MAEEQQTQEPGASGGQEPQTFSLEYVKELRQEAAKHRTDKNKLKEQLESQADYADLKAGAQKWAKHEESLKSEGEKQAEVLATLQSQNEELSSRLKGERLRTAFIVTASELDVAHPEDAFRLSDHTKVEYGEDGEIKLEGIETMVKGLIEDGRLPKKGVVKAPNLDGGTGGGRRGSGQQTSFTEAEIREQAARLGVRVENLAEAYGVKLKP